MKKITAAAVATAMTMSLAVAPAADAATNRMQSDGTCNLTMDDANDIEGFTPELAAWQLYAEPGSYEGTIASSRWGEATGSSQEYDVRYSNNLQAMEACAQKKDFDSSPVAGAEKAGIIIGTVLLALASVGLLALPFLAPQLKRYLPF